jgi:hypothetical protein
MAAGLPRPESIVDAPRSDPAIGVRNHPPPAASPNPWAWPDTGLITASQWAHRRFVPNQGQWHQRALARGAAAWIADV